MKWLWLFGAVGLFVTMSTDSVQGQASKSVLGVSLSEPYSATSIGIEGEWSTASGAWRVTGFGSTGTEAELSTRPWLLESFVTRRFGSNLPVPALLSGGFRTTRQPSGTTEVAFPVLVGTRVPLLSGNEWRLDAEGHIGLSYRAVAGERVVARANRVSLMLNVDRFRFTVSHDDAAGSNSPFLYGGAARVSVGWRIR